MSCSAVLKKQLEGAFLSRRYSPRAGWIRKARDDFGRDGPSLNRAGSLWIGRGPNALFETFERELALLKDPVADGEAASSPFADLSLNNDFFVEAARHEEPRSHLDYGYAYDTVFFSHR